ncbi:MAG: HAMP domain-containing histidine kinase [Lachnospiraceae bacterium]|nr:HAMP domain-containing histidine kinase [Lachnospiraceae bacterium]
MAKNKKVKRNKKEEPRIILFTAIICAVLCLIYIPIAKATVLAYLYSYEPHDYTRQYMRQYLERYESILDGTAEEPTSPFFDSAEDIVNLFYGAVNDKSAPSGGMIGLPGSSALSFPLFRYGGAVWIADRESGELITRGDLLVLHEGNKRLLCDIRTTFSDEECSRISSYYYKIINPVFYVDDIVGFNYNYPYVEKYVCRDGIIYPLVITFTEEDGEKVSFISDKPFEYDPSEVTESSECIFEDDMIDPLDPWYLLAKQLSDQSYAKYLSDPEHRQYPSDFTASVKGAHKTYIIRTSMETTDRNILCYTEIIDYTGILRILRIAGCLVITLICTVIALILCLRARRRRKRAEYERSLTNALAHNYKSSLMIVRGCAENLIAGVSEEKKARYEKKIMSETDRMNESTEKILSFYRTGAAGYEPSSDRIDAAAVCRELVVKYESVTESRSIKWEVDDKEKFSFEGDTLLFTMAMDNLIGNAAKYALSASIITVRTCVNGLTLENSWTPVDKFIKKPKRFFEAFVTGDDTPGRSNSGLGLSVAKDLLERMGLKISARADSSKVSFEIKKK